MLHSFNHLFSNKHTLKKIKNFEISTLSFINIVGIFVYFYCSSGWLLSIRLLIHYWLIWYPDNLFDRFTELKGKKKNKCLITNLVLVTVIKSELVTLFLTLKFIFEELFRAVSKKTKILKSCYKMIYYMLQLQYFRICLSKRTIFNVTKS